MPTQGPAPAPPPAVAEPEISVAVCTRNRAPELDRLLGSLRAMEVPDDLSWELLVVDNGSTDGTAALLAGWGERLPLRIVPEARAGLSHARNAAAAAARGRYICWTDDDALVPPAWLRTYRDGFRRYPDAALFGGRIVPRAEAPATAWFAERMGRWPLSSVVAGRDLGPADRPLQPRGDAVPWGANFAIRTVEQRRLRYDPQLDHGEETDVMGRLLASGASGWWLGESEVTHMVPAERQTRRYLAAYFRRAGRAAACLRQRRTEGAEAGLTGVDGWTGRSEPALAAAKIASGLLARAAWAAGQKSVALRALARESYLTGVLAFRRGEAR